MNLKTAKMLRGAARAATRILRIPGDQRSPFRGIMPDDYLQFRNSRKNAVVNSDGKVERGPGTIVLAPESPRGAYRALKRNHRARHAGE